MKLAQIFTFIALGVLATGSSAGSVLNLSLDSLELSGSPGSLLTFTGSLSNFSTANVFVNSVDLGISYSELAVDFSFFLLHSPPILLPGETYSGTMFTIGVSDIAESGVYNAFFEIQGGMDSDAFGPLAQEDVTVSVSNTPEPNYCLLIAATILIFLVGQRRRLI